MVDMVLLQSVSYIAGALGVCVAAVYYVMNLRVQQANMKSTLETRQTQVFMEVFDRFNNMEMMKAFNEVVMNMNYKDYDEFLEKYGWEKNPDYYIHFDLIGWNFHGMGVLVKKNQIDPELVTELIGAGVITFWDKAKPFYLEWRRRYNIPAYKGIDYLYEVTRDIYYSKHPEVLKSK